MTPNSPEPSMDWRDSNTNKKALKPLVKVSVPPRMPKRKKSNGFLALLKSIFTLSFLRSGKKKKKVQPRKRKNYNKNSKSASDKPRNARNPRNPRNNPRGKQAPVKKTADGKSPKPVVIPPKKVVNKDENSSETKQPEVKSESVEKNGNVANVEEVDKSAENPAVNPVPSPAPTQAPTPAPKPTRALNDPRYKSE